jgi:hypothetical protein
LYSILKIFIVVSFSQPSFLFQMPQSGASYMMTPNEEARMQQGGPWAQYTTTARQQQGM